jgi:hypothetical protein
MFGSPGDMTSIIAYAQSVSGPFIHVEPEAFEALLSRSESPLVVCAPAGLLGAAFQYVTSYKGLTFHTKSKQMLRVPPQAEIIQAQRMTVPM